MDLLAARLVGVNLAESTATLKRLYDLLDSVPHMPVNHDIQQLVSDSLRQHERATAAVAQQRWSEAGQASQAALDAAHRAFFHPAMLPALYFPDEHLYAVYLPLFLPISVPIIGALLNRLTRSQENARKAKKKRLREEAKEKEVAAEEQQQQQQQQQDKPLLQSTPSDDAESPASSIAERPAAGVELVSRRTSTQLPAAVDSTDTS